MRLLPIFLCLNIWATSPQVYFSPNGGCTEIIVEKIARARKEILVQAYSFTSAPIAQALSAAKGRKVSVKVILNKSQRAERYTVATYLNNAGVYVWIDSGHTIAHNKVMVIDGETVITGSFNFTKAAETSNAENVLILTDKTTAGMFKSNWAVHQTHSEPF